MMSREERSARIKAGIARSRERTAKEAKRPARRAVVTRLEKAPITRALAAVFRALEPLTLEERGRVIRAYKKLFALND